MYVCFPMRTLIYKEWNKMNNEHFLLKNIHNSVNQYFLSIIDKIFMFQWMVIVNCITAFWLYGSKLSWFNRYLNKTVSFLCTLVIVWRFRTLNYNETVFHQPMSNIDKKSSSGYQLIDYRIVTTALFIQSNAMTTNLSDLASCTSWINVK